MSTSAPRGTASELPLSRTRVSRRTARGTRFLALLGLVALACSCTPQLLATYLGDTRHTNTNAVSKINTLTAGSMQLKWTAQGGRASSAQPVVWNGMAFWGDWNGNEHATTLDGQAKWSTNLGTTTSCFPGTTGVASTATIAKVDNRALVLVGGGDAKLYALDALTGAVVWSTRLGSSPNTFIWGSPSVYLDNIYIGVSSSGACPLVQGKLMRIDVRTGAIRSTFKVVPDGCIGGGVSSSAAIDAAAGLLYIGTGNNEFSCDEPLATALVALRLDDLSVVSSWQPPPGELTLDGDFLAAPTLFPGTIAGVTRKLVGIPNKNGNFYVFRADSISSGPLWRAPIAVAAQCPCNGAAISPAAFDGTRLYVGGGGSLNPDGTWCGGTLQALDPSTGTSLWRRCYPSSVLGAATVAGSVLDPDGGGPRPSPGVVIIGSGPALHIVASLDGRELFTYAPGLGNFWAPVTLTDRLLLVPNMNGNLLALGLTPTS